MKRKINKALSLALTVLMFMGLLSMVTLPANAYTVPQTRSVVSTNKPIVATTPGDINTPHNPQIMLKAENDDRYGYWVTDGGYEHAFIIDLEQQTAFNTFETEVLYIPSDNWLCQVSNYRIYGSNSASAAFSGENFNPAQNGWVLLNHRQGNYNQLDRVVLENTASYRYVLFVANEAECRIVRFKVIMQDRIPSELIEFTNTPAATVPVGARDNLKAVVQPTNADVKAVTWTSSNSAVIKIDEEGRWEALQAGSATITATTVDTNITETCVITAVNVPVQSVEIKNNPALVDVGQKSTLSTKLIPDNATIKNITWASSNSGVISINTTTGMYEAISAGTATITAAASNGASDSVVIDVQAVPGTQIPVQWEQVLPAPKDGKGYPASNPTLPSGISKFNPGWTSTAPAAGVPVIYEFTKTASADESIAIMGEYFTPDTRFIVYYQTASNEGLYLDALIQSIDGSQKATITLPTVEQGISSTEMYAVWAINDIGAGYPMLINKTEGWWVGPYNGSVGERVSAFGTNLTKSNTNKNDITHIYLESKVGSNHMWVPVGEYNPNKVDFLIPSLPTGDYNVWVHNGNGGEYGFSYAGNLNIASAKPWTSNIINVKSYGAVGNGINDDTTAIRNAINAAGSMWSTVYFPAGTYKITGRLTGNSNTKYTGAGKANTLIMGYGNIDFMLYLDSRSNVEVSEMTLNSENVTVQYENAWDSWNNQYNIGVINGRGISHSIYKNVDIFCPRGASAFYMKDCERWENVRVEGCTLQSIPIKVLGNHIYFRDTLFIGRSDAEEMVHSWGSFNIVFENCSYRDFNNANDGVNNDFAQRFYVENNAWGGSGYMYFGGNNLEKINPHKNSWMAGNAGEILLFESSLGKKLGHGTNITATTFNIGMNLQVAHYMEFILAFTGSIYITSGTGAGQMRQIKNGNDWYNNSNLGLVEVDRAWDVMPDATSYFVITVGTRNVAIYGNKLSGESDYTRPSASTGVNFFCSARDVVVSNNIFTDVRTGFSMYGSWYREADYAQNAVTGSIIPGIGIIRNCLFANNTIYNANSGMLYMYHDFTPDYSIVQGESTVQVTNGTNVVRNNKFSNIASNGLTVSSGGIADDANNVFEKNTINDAPVAISFNTWETNSFRTWKGLFYNNIFDRGIASFSGSRAVWFSRDEGMHDYNLRNNKFIGYSDYAAIETGVLPGPKLEVPYRNFKSASEGGVKAELSVDLWNVGLGSLDWTASTDTPWLEIVNNLGAINGNTASGSTTGELQLKCDPNKKTTTTETGMVAITAEGRTINVFVEFTGSFAEAATWQTQPAKKVYFIGEELDLTGGKLYVELSDGSDSEIDVTPDMISGYNKNTAGVQTITVSFASFDLTYDVEVFTNVITSIGVDTQIDKKTYFVGEELDLTGGKIVTNYLNGDAPVINITSDMISGYNKNTAGTQTITVTHEGKTTAFTVEVIVNAVTSITVDTQITKKTYYVGENLDITDGKIVVNYLNGESSVIDITAAMISGYNKNNAATQTITITYEGKTTTFTVLVKQDSIIEISMDKLPLRTDYILGETFSALGGKIAVIYDSGLIEYINLTLNMASGFDSVSAGTKTITVTHVGFTTTFDVSVVSSYPAGGMITVSDTSGKAGDTVTVTLTITNNPGIIGMFISMHYDDSVLQFTGYSDEGTVLDEPMHSGQLSWYPFNMSWMSFLGDGVNNLNNGLLITLTFKILDTAQAGNTDIIITYAKNDIYSAIGCAPENFNIKNGKIEIKPSKLAGDANGDGTVNASDAALVRQHALGGYSISSINMINADANDDKSVNASDASIIRQYALGGYRVELASDGSKLYIP